MQERRRSVRTELHAELVIERLDTKLREKVTIQVCDVSKGGIGFFCAEQLEIGSMYECFLTIWTKEVIRTFIKVVRGGEQKQEAGYRYGGSFIGMTDTDAFRIEVYQTVEKYKNKA